MEISSCADAGHCNTYFHAIAIYVPTKICPSNAMYANEFICRYETTMSVYMPHLNSVQSIMLPDVLAYISYYWYVSEQVSLPYYIYMSRCTATVVYILMHYYCTYCCGVLASFFMETYFVHWAHGIEDTDIPGVVVYYYLFNTLAVRSQYNESGYLRGLKPILKNEED